MTLLVTIATPEFSLLCSDMRISIQQGNWFVPVDEKFNKHIIFHSNGLTADITYTGVARWVAKGQTVTLYDVISDSVAESAKARLAFGPLAYRLVVELSKALNQPSLFEKETNLNFELHVIGRHEKIPWPLIAVISTFRKQSPWPAEGDIYHKEFIFPGISLFTTAAEHPTIFFGGMDNLVRDADRRRLTEAIQRGADGFNASRLAAKLVEDVSKRSNAVGPTSVSVVMPAKGMIDTNLWDKAADGVCGYMPRMVFSNGSMMGPSEFPVTLQALLEGHLPKHSLFFKSIAVAHSKKSVRRRIFRNKRGKAIPGIMGLVMLGLFGKVPEGFSDLGFGNDPSEG